MSGNPKTPADLLFEEYLTAQGVRDSLYEQPLPRTSRTPDYQLPRDPLPLLFEVKGFDVDVPKGFGAVDPYSPLTAKITAARKKFRDLEEYCCSLVLHYSGPGMVFLEPMYIYGAMLGKVGFTIPIDSSGELPVVVDNANMRQVFTTGGRMIVYGKGGRPIDVQNTTISSVVVVEHYAVGRRRFMRQVREQERQLQRDATSEELWEAMARYAGTEFDVSLMVVRVIVHENPYARIPLPRDLFVGAHDERYGVDQQGRIGRLFAGQVVATLDEPSM